jgi:hypothetical protein
MSPFEPVGETARWRIVYGLLQPLATGATLTYEQIGEALGLLADDDRHTIQMAVRRAGVESERVDLRALEAVPNVGYRIVEPEEHGRLAQRQQRRSSRALKSGHSKVVNVDLNGVDPEVRKAFQVMAQAFSMQMDFNRRMDVRQKRLETAVASVEERHDRSANEVAELKERLERLENLTGDKET